MKPERLARLESVIRETLATMLLTGAVKDPRTRGLSLTRTSISNDGKVFTGWVSILGGPGLAQDLGEYRERTASALQGLESASPYLRREISKVLGLKFTPEIRFKEDLGLENADRVSAILKTLSVSSQTV